MLIVLMIFSVLTMIVFSMTFRFYEKETYEQATEKLRMTLHYAQHFALENRQDVWVYAEDKRIVVRTVMAEEIMEWALPVGMTVTVTTLQRIKFNTKGNVSQGGQIKIHTPNGQQNFSINLSRGRLRSL